MRRNGAQAKSGGIIDLYEMLASWWGRRPALKKCAWCGQPVWVPRDAANPTCSPNCAKDMTRYGAPTDDEIPF